MMRTRTLTGICLFSLVVLAVYLGGTVFSVFWVTAMCVAMLEIYRAFQQAGHRPVAWPCWATLILSVPYFLIRGQQSGTTVLVVLLYVCFMAVSAIVMFRKGPKLPDLLVSLEPLFHIVLPGLSMLGLARIEPMYKQRLLMAAVFLIPMLGDVGAYFSGYLFGKTKLCPEVSPKKTVEGAIGGLLASVLAAALVYGCGTLTRNALPPLWHFLLLGLAGGVVGQLGDLFASLVKRHAGVKDYGRVFPGHGGVMDRLDSVLFVSVLVFLYQTLWV